MKYQLNAVNLNEDNMLECLVLGDSLAVGVGQVRQECTTRAKSGINSYDYVNRHVWHTNGNDRAKTIIISLGSNDTAKINTFEELDTLRQLVKADRVYWILPAIKEEKRKAVWAVADKYHDHVIETRNHELSPDRVHPTGKGYKTISNQTK
jgi:lysophospholipase L1-like esterase